MSLAAAVAQQEVSQSNTNMYRLYTDTYSIHQSDLSSGHLVYLTLRGE